MLISSLSLDVVSLNIFTYMRSLLLISGVTVRQLSVVAADLFSTSWSKIWSSWSSYTLC